MGEQMDDGWEDGWINEWMDGWMDEQKDEWETGWVDGWKKRQVDGWMDSQMTDRNLDCILFRLNQVELLFWLFKMIKYLILCRPKHLRGKGTDVCNLL